MKMAYNPRQPRNSKRKAESPDIFGIIRPHSKKKPPTTRQQSNSSNRSVSPSFSPSHSKNVHKVELQKFLYADRVLIEKGPDSYNNSRVPEKLPPSPYKLPHWMGISPRISRFLINVLISSPCPTNNW